MKGLRSLFLLALLAVSPPSAVSENDLVSIRELFTQCGGGWHEVYETKWRTVAIDMDDIDVPAAEKLPVFTVKIRDYPSLERLNDLNMTLLYPHLTAQKLGIQVEVGKPSHVENTTKKRYKYEDTHRYSLAQLKNTPLRSIFAAEGAGDSAQTAHEQFLDIVARLWEQETMKSLRLYSLFTEGPLLALGKGNAVVGVLRDEGHYAFSYQQCLDGIPLLPDFLSYSRNIRGERRVPYQQVFFYSYSENDYALAVNLLETIEKKQDDIPVLGLDAIQSTMEALISAGNLRSIEEMSFGYLIYLDPTDATLFWTVPTWKIDCGWCDSPKTPSDRSNDERLYIDAQTGKILDPNARNADRRHVPAFLTWDDISQTP